MNDDFLQPIFSENDLIEYENFINTITPKVSQNFTDFLNGLMNKRIKIFMVVGNQLIAKQGKVLEVNSDYIILLQNCEKLAIKLCEIKFLSVM